jgi:hypothetical protein
VLVVDDEAAEALCGAAERDELAFALAVSPGSSPAFIRPARNARITMKAPTEVPATRRQVGCQRGARRGGV